MSLCLLEKGRREGPHGVIAIPSLFVSHRTLLWRREGERGIHQYTYGVHFNQFGCLHCNNMHYHGILEAEKFFVWELVNVILFMQCLSGGLPLFPEKKEKEKVIDSEQVFLLFLHHFGETFFLGWGNRGRVNEKNACREKKCLKKNPKCLIE